MTEIMRRGTPKITKAQWAQFIEDLRLWGNATGAARRAGFDPKSARRHKETDEAFGEAWVEAIEEWRGSLMEAATKRARDGYPEFLTCKDGLIYDREGEPVSNVKYSDNVLIKMLQAEFQHHRPQPAVAAVPTIPPELMADPEPTPDEGMPDNPIL